MISISTTHPLETCTAFAVQWLKALAAYDLAQLERLIDRNESGGLLADSFPPPEGFTYAGPDQAVNWTMHVVGASDAGLSLHFEVPFVEPDFRPGMARFSMRRKGEQLEVTFESFVPT